MRHLPLIVIGAVALLVLGLILVLPGPGPELTGDNLGRMIYLLVLLGVLTFWWGSSRLSWGEIGRDFKYLAYWAAILLGLVALYGLRDDFAYVWRSTLAELNPSNAVATGEGEIMLAAGPGGHFHVQAKINGVPVSMIVDTGASDVALTRADARRVGIDVDALSFDRPYETANGIAYSAPVTLKSVRIEGIEVKNVRASVGTSELKVSLLGMSFLNRMSKMEMTPSRLILRQ